MLPFRTKADARAVANYFIDKALAAGSPLTHLQIHKLIYFAQGWTLAILDKPLISDEIEAWKYGPVVRSVFDAFKRFGGSKITSPAVDEWTELPIQREFSAKEREIMDDVYHALGNTSAYQLSALTHEKDGPWDLTFSKEKTVIPTELIKEHFKARLHATE
jgi:uncharacterized phage-associated protein